MIFTITVRPQAILLVVSVVPRDPLGAGYSLGSGPLAAAFVYSTLFSGRFTAPFSSGRVAILSTRHTMVYLKC